jgi:ribosomal protein S14
MLRRVGPFKSRRFGGTYRLRHQGEKNRRARSDVMCNSNRGTLRRNAVLRNVLRLLATANVVPSLLILVTRMMEAIRSSETSVLSRAAWRNIPEDGILQRFSRCGQCEGPTISSSEQVFKVTPQSSAYFVSSPFPSVHLPMTPLQNQE